MVQVAAAETTFQRRRLAFVLEALQPIAQMSETMGNEGILMRKRVRQTDGWASVPYVTANAMRNRMREAASYALLDAAGLLGAKLSEAALRLLFSGGMVTGKGDAGTVNLDAYRRMVEAIPTLALFGGCAGNRIIPGRLRVEDATLICLETERQTPSWMLEWVQANLGRIDNCRAHVEEVQRVRMDPTLSAAKQKLLAAGEQTKVTERFLASEGASEAGDHKAADASKSTMMPHRFERIAQGSLFSWACEADCYSELEVDTFMVTVAAFFANCRVGGRSATGHGLLHPVHAADVKLGRPSEALEALDASALGRRVGDIFRGHVRERSEDLRRFLAEVDA